ncbi:hypothetical protein ACE6H2_015066 [Prunus campanulata]
MSSFFKRFFSKPPRTTFEGLRDGYGTIDAVVGTTKVVYAVGTLGPATAARAALQSFTHDTDLAILKDKVNMLEDRNLPQVHCNACKDNSTFDSRKSLTEYFGTIHDKAHKLCGEKLLCKEPIYPKHEIHICISFGVSRINRNELRRKRRRRRTRREWEGGRRTRRSKRLEYAGSLGIG